MTTTLEPMVNNRNQVHTTTDYSLFKQIDGNRTKNLLHINRLKKSMSENYLFTVIIVNERYEIIDGQHRFDAIIDLKLPLNYIVCDGYGLNEVHILNQNAKTWNSDDYLTGYCNLGYIDYLKYAEFKNKYDLGHNEAMSLLACSPSKIDIELFYKGEFKIKDYSKACEMIEKIAMVQPYYANYKRRSFIYAMMSLFKNPNFDFSHFLQKLRLQPSAMVDCTNVSNYKEVIEDIYN